MYVMVDDAGKYKIVKIININGSSLTDVNGDKYNKEKIKYVWVRNQIPIKNPGYTRKHLLKEENDGNQRIF